MAQTPVSKSAQVNNAAKDDVVGLGSDDNFTISDLLANDPGGAAKIDVTTQFFFGDTAPVGGGIPSIATQVAYLASHGITAILNTAGTAFKSFDIGSANVSDINYFVQIGNKGTWSQAHVDVEASEPPPPPVDTHHNGALVANWDFENHVAGNDEIGGAPTGFWNLNEWAASHPGIYGNDADNFGFTGGLQVHGVDGHRALDTAGSPGNIFLQAIPMERGGQAINGGTMPDLVAGQEYHAEVSILRQNLSHIPGMTEAGTEGTDPDAWVSFAFNDTVLEVHADNAKFNSHDNEFVTFDVTFEGQAGEDGFSVMSHGTHDDAQGLLIDTIQIHDWIV